MNQKKYKLFELFSMVYVVTLIVSNTLSVKVFTMFGLVLPAGIITFPIVYILNDSLVECYGYEKVRKITWYAIFCQFLMAGFYYLATIIPPADFWKDQEAFAKFFGFVPRIVAGSFSAFIVGSFANAYIMSLLKVKTQGKYLWLRAISSTIVGEGLDSLIFNLVAFTGVYEFKTVLFIALSGFVFKTLYETICVPFTYLFVGWLKRYENEDKYDKGISYNPFTIRD